jgi:hypothetical protein
MGAAVRQPTNNVCNEAGRAYVFRRSAGCVAVVCRVGENERSDRCARALTPTKMRVQAVTRVYTIVSLALFRTCP